MIWVPIVCALVVAERGVNYYNSCKAAEASENIYNDVRFECNKNIKAKKKAYKEKKRKLEELNRLEEMLRREGLL